MSIRGSVGSLFESHRAKTKRPDRRIVLRQPGQSDAKKATGLKATDDADAYEHSLTIQNAADLKLPTTDPANAPRPRRIQTGPLPAGSLRPASNADAASTQAVTGNKTNNVKTKCLLVAMAVIGLAASRSNAKTGVTNIIDNVTTNVSRIYYVGSSGPFNALIITNGSNVACQVESYVDCNANDGELQLVAVRKHLPDVLKVRPISDHGNVAEIAQRFGGFEKLGDAVNKLQSLLYAP
jgi:hypothetical protein